MAVTSSGVPQTCKIIPALRICAPRERPAGVPTSWRSFHFGPHDVDRTKDAPIHCALRCDLSIGWSSPHQVAALESASSPLRANRRRTHLIPRQPQHSPVPEANNSPDPMVSRNTIVQSLTTTRLNRLLPHGREDKQGTHRPVHPGMHPAARLSFAPRTVATTRLSSRYKTHVLQPPRHLRGRRAGHSLRRLRTRIAARAGGGGFSRTLCARPCHPPASRQTMLRSSRRGGACAI